MQDFITSIQEYSIAIPASIKHYFWLDVFGHESIVDENDKFEIEGLRCLAEQLNLNANNIYSNAYRRVDKLWKSRTTNSSIFVGDHSAAQDLKLMHGLGIRKIVNCTFAMKGSQKGRLPNYLESSGFEYFEFNIAEWLLDDDVNSSKSVLAFIQGMISFVDEAIKRGENVLIHCLAGAHRAGATAIALLMHLTGMSAAEATSAAKICRPVIDPIGHLKTCLRILERDISHQRSDLSTVPINVVDIFDKDDDWFFDSDRSSSARSHSSTVTSSPTG